MNGVASAFSRAAAAASGPVSAPAPARRFHDRRYLKLIGGMIWILVVLMIVPDDFDYGNLSSDTAPASGGFAGRLMWFILLSGGLVVIASRTVFAWQLVRSLNPFLLAFALLAMSSAIWSMDPPVTLRRMIRVFAILIDSIAFVMIAWHPQRFQSVLRPIITAVLAGSIVFGLVLPDLAIHQDITGVLVGAWHGLTNHKNSLGDIACVGLIFWLHAWLSGETSTLVAFAGAGVAAVCLYLSHSSTALVATVFTLLFMVLLQRSPQALRRYMPYLVTLFVVALLTYSVALLRLIPGIGLLLSPISAMTGKDMTFTGRTDIWAILMDHISLHPYLGTGYGAYWTGAFAGMPSYDFVRLLDFYPGSAHNGYLEILNDLGAVGLLVLFGYLASFVVQSLRLLPLERNQAALYLALFLQQAITNLSESRWLSALSVDFVIMTLATTALARALLEYRLRQRLGAPQRAIRPLAAAYIHAPASASTGRSHDIVH